MLPAAATAAGASHPDAELFALRDQMSALMDRKSAVDEQTELRYRQMSNLCCQYGSTSEALRLA
jgi:flagellar capping protein FliD